MFEVNMDLELNKADFYKALTGQGLELIEGENDLIANLANLSALLNTTLKDINWVGFYLYKGGELVLGPFQGKVACYRIPLTRGVCGEAAATGKTMVVPNVHEFPGHIACDHASNSEVVVPIVVEEKLIGVLDIDSPIIGRFTDEDGMYLRQWIATLFDKEIFKKWL